MLIEAIKYSQNVGEHFNLLYLYNASLKNNLRLLLRNIK